jgi:hypothetical protein
MLMQDYRQVEIDNNKYLSDDGQLEEVPDFSAIVGEMADKHEEVDEEKCSQVALL